MTHTIGIEYCGHPPTLNKELRPGQAYVLRAHGDFVGAFDSLEAAGRPSGRPAHEEMLAAINEAGWTILPDDRAAVAATYARLPQATPAHTFACRAHAIGCAVENIGDASPDYLGDDPVTEGDQYLADGTAACYCDRHPLGMAWAIRWILLGGEALTAKP